ncbi:MAG: LptF/LptG family permease [Planctomycetales bacterium]|nr:LptF/LptG family permease [Planctomycetales bacterium]
MRILSRYIVFDLLKVFSFTLISMTAFMFLVLIGKEAVEEGLGMLPILRLMPYMLPQAMQFAVPGAMLLATTSVYGRVAAANEIVAIKSLGISPMVLIWPTLILAGLVSFGAVVLNDVAVSWGRGGVQQVILESLEEIVYGRLRTTRSFSNDKLKVTVKHLEGKQLVQPTFLFFPSKDRDPWTITADYAELSANKTENSVLLTLTNADVDLGGKGSGYHPGLWELPISLADFNGQVGNSRSPSSLSLREIGPAKSEQTEQIDQLKQEMAADAAFALMTGRTFELSQRLWQQKTSNVSSAQYNLQRLKTEPHRRWSNGFSCLCFVLIGAPMAVRRRHGEFWGSFFACFLPILLVYYPLLVGCVDQAKSGVFPPQAVWLGNLVLAVWGIWLMRRVVRF